MDDDWPEDDLAAALARPEPSTSGPSNEFDIAPDGISGERPAPGDISGEQPAQTTEWFSVEDYLAEEDAPPILPRRIHHVTAVVVSHDGSVLLPAVLTTLAQQRRPIDAAEAFARSL